MKSFTNAEKSKLEAKAIALKADNLDADNLPTANIIVAGITGVGKSTLINAVFGEQLAKTGTGKPVTETMDMYNDENIPIRIWDTVGLELNSEKTQRSIADISKTISSKQDNKDPFDRIHAIWYCINYQSRRYQGDEVEFVKKLHTLKVPFIIVMTRCDGDEADVDGFENEIRELNAENGMPDIDIVQVIAEDIKFRGGGVIKAFGLDDLVNITLKNLPEFIKGGFAAAQRISKDMKRVQCEELIYNYVDAAQQGFWDKVPFVNIFTTDSKVRKLFRDLGKLFNANIPDEKIEDLIKNLRGLDVENGFWGLVFTLNNAYNKKMNKFFEERKNQGLNVQMDKLTDRERVSRLLAFYGYVFLDAIEEVWDESTESQLRNMNFVIERLTAVIKRKFKLSK